MKRVPFTVSRGIRSGLFVGGLIIAGLTLAHCAGQPPKAPSQPTPDQVRGNADRTFDKLKQEERERGIPSTPPR